MIKTSETHSIALARIEVLEFFLVDLCGHFPALRFFKTMHLVLGVLVLLRRPKESCAPVTLALARLLSCKDPAIAVSGLACSRAQISLKLRFLYFAEPVRLMDENSFTPSELTWNPGSSADIETMRDPLISS